jgi:hypothetical protein
LPLPPASNLSSRNSRISQFSLSLSLQYILHVDTPFWFTKESDRVTSVSSRPSPSLADDGPFASGNYGSTSASVPYSVHLFRSSCRSSSLANFRPADIEEPAELCASSSFFVPVPRAPSRARSQFHSRTSPSTLSSFHPFLSDAPGPGLGPIPALMARARKSVTVARPVWNPQEKCTTVAPNGEDASSKARRVRIRATWRERSQTQSATRIRS